MHIGVVSDTHNNAKNIKKIIKLFNEEEVSLVIHTGDIASARSLEIFNKLNCNLIGVYGNNDRNEPGIEEIASKYNFEFQAPPKLLFLENRTIAVFHEPEYIDNFLLSNEVDLVLHGHTHRYRNEIIQGVLFFNPGESAGMQKGRNAIGIINLKTLEAKRIFF